MNSSSCRVFFYPFTNITAPRQCEDSLNKSDETNNEYTLYYGKMTLVPLLRIDFN